MALILLLLGLLLAFGRGSSVDQGPVLEQPEGKRTPIVFTIHGRRIVAVRPRTMEGNMIELRPGAAIGVTVRGRADVPRALTLTSLDCDTVRRYSLPAGARAWRVPRVEEGPYELTASAGSVRGSIPVAIFSGRAESCRP